MSDFQKSTQKKGDTLVRIETDLGAILLRFFPEEAPKTVENFLALCKKGYYNGVIFHRVIPDFMVQWGDPTGTGMGGESSFGGEFDSEISPKLSHIVGALSMANAGPNTNGSQFFIVQGSDAKYLDGDYSIFGQVIEGQETVDRMAKVPRNRNDKPLSDVRILSVEIETVQ